MRTWSIILMLALLPLTAASQAPTMQTPTPPPSSAQDYFNLAARQYVKEDKHAALRTLDKGLTAYPGDAPMLKLAEELLKEQPPQPQPQQQQQQQQEQQEQQQQNQQQQQQQEQQQEQRNSEGLAKQDAERMLDALERQEKDTQEKVQARRTVRRVRVAKDW